MCWERSSQEQGSDSMLARPEPGTQRENAPQTWKSLVPRCGVLKESKNPWDSSGDGGLSGECVCRTAQRRRKFVVGRCFFTKCLHSGQPRTYMATIWACNWPCSHGSAQQQQVSRSGCRNWQHRSSVTWRRPRTCLIAAFVGRLSWEELRLGARPGPQEAEPGEWPHGWQYFASSTSEHHFRDTVVIAQSCTTDKAHPRSLSGAGCADVLCGRPTRPEFALQPTLFPHNRVGKTPFATAGHGGSLRKWSGADQRGRHRAVSPVWQAPNQGNPDGEDIGAGVPRGRGFSQVQREAPRHEHCCPCFR